MKKLHKVLYINIFDLIIYIFVTYKMTTSLIFFYVLLEIGE